jgi:hypothetical protein
LLAGTPTTAGGFSYGLVILAFVTAIFNIVSFEIKISCLALLKTVSQNPFQQFLSS